MIIVLILLALTELVLICVYINHRNFLRASVPYRVVQAVVIGSEERRRKCGKDYVLVYMYDIDQQDLYHTDYTESYPTQKDAMNCFGDTRTFIVSTTTFAIIPNLTPEAFKEMLIKKDYSKQLLFVIDVVGMLICVSIFIVFWR